MLILEKISKSFGGKDILQNVSLKVGQSQKLALVGANGIGKSTLLKIIIGEIKPDEGFVLKDKELRIGYLPQEIDESNYSKTIKSYLEEITGISKMRKSMAELENNLSSKDALLKYGELQEKFIAMDAYNFDFKLDEILNGFDLKKFINCKINTLSGGQKSKISLTGLLLQNFDLLLLDEPTNNLDLKSIIWLENFFKKTNCACLIVSHDRCFLDKIVSKVFEIDWYERNIKKFPGTYTDYLKQKKQEQNRKTQEYIKAKEEKDRLIISAREKKEWGNKESRKNKKDNDKYAHGYRNDRTANKAGSSSASIDKKVKKLSQIEKPREKAKIIVPLLASENPAKHGISLDNVLLERKNFSLGPVNLNIKYGDRIGIIGPNGSGKSTLLSLISQENQPSKGSVKISPSLIVGNLTQAHENMFPEEKISDFFKRNKVNDSQRMFLMLDKLGISADDVQKKISQLSPGERARILMALFSALSVNVLLLDEPTNHLDLESIEALEDALIDYTGTLIFISHDRTFLEKINPNELILIESGKLNFIGSYSEYKINSGL